MNYYYIGGASGSLATANDWSLTEGGDPLDTLTLADGDAFYIASDATIALSGTSATLAVKSHDYALLLRSVNDLLLRLIDHGKNQWDEFSPGVV